MDKLFPVLKLLSIVEDSNVDIARRGHNCCKC